MKITMVGAGYVGLVTGVCFAEVGHEVLCVDNDTTKIDKLRQGVMPIYEEGLEEMVAKNVADGRLHFSSSLKEGTDFSEIIFIAVGTPPGFRGQANLVYVEQVAREVASYMKSYRLLVEKSTVPVNSGENLRRTIGKYLDQDIEFDVASNPEFLREGTAVKDALQPDRIVIGTESERARDLLRKVYRPLLDRCGGELVEMNIASAELTKHASNSFLAMKISFINAVARICDLAGADVQQVARGMGMDQRIGPHFLNAGVGYGGSCFPKDVDAFNYLSDQMGYQFNLLKVVQQINLEQREYMLEHIRKELWVLQNKTVAIWGLAFKPGTDDIREAPSLFFVEQLKKAGVRLRLWDPAAAENFRNIHPDPDYFEDTLECAAGADLLLILTEWPQIQATPMAELCKAMACPVVVDGRNMLDPKIMREMGFTYYSVGRP